MTRTNETTAAPVITFGRFERVPAGDDAEAWIFRDGARHGEIVRTSENVQRIGVSWKIASYTVALPTAMVTFYVQKDRDARATLAAAKAFARKAAAL